MFAQNEGVLQCIDHAYSSKAAEVPQCPAKIGAQNNHGWVHENPAMLTPEQERHVLERGLETLDRIAGVRPVGYRSPGWDNSQATVSLLLEYGFEYESSLMGSDYTPYWCRVGDEFSTTEEYRWGRPVDLVEVPVAWHFDDFPPFEHVWLRFGAVHPAPGTSCCASGH